MLSKSEFNLATAAQGARNEMLELTFEPARQARTLQSSLAALAERIDEVRQDHDKLESENKFLQDYIGGLTRTMSKSELTSSTGSIKRKK